MSNIDYLKEQNQNLEQQLVALYQEKQEAGDPQSLRSTLVSLEEQLVALYQEKQQMPVGVEGLKEMLKSLEEQVVALYEEKALLHDKMVSMDRKVVEMKAKSKAIGAALLEAALFGDAEEVA